MSHHVREARGFYDALADVVRQQANVRWHLTALARLSDERECADPPRPGWAPHEGWDPAWAQPALRDPRGGVLWLAGSSNVEMGTAPEGVPVLWVPTIGWYDVWDDYDDGSLPSGRWSTGRLSADWWGLVELERRLLEPYVLRAAEFQVEVRRAGFGRDLSRKGESWRTISPARSSSTSAAGGARCSRRSTSSWSRACVASLKSSGVPGSAASVASHSSPSTRAAREPS